MGVMGMMRIQNPPPKWAVALYGKGEGWFETSPYGVMADRFGETSPYGVMADRFGETSPYGVMADGYGAEPGGGGFGEWRLLAGRGMWSIVDYNRAY